MPKIYCMTCGCATQYSSAKPSKCSCGESFVQPVAIAHEPVVEKPKKKVIMMPDNPEVRKERQEEEIVATPRRRRRRRREEPEELEEDYYDDSEVLDVFDLDPNEGVKIVGGTNGRVGSIGNTVDAQKPVASAGKKVSREQVEARAKAFEKMAQTESKEVKA